VKVEELVSKQLIEKVSPDWWNSEEGLGFLKRQELKRAWVSLLSQLGCNVWFTITFEKAAQSAMLAVDRTTRLLKKAHKSIQMDCNAFVVGEQHTNGTYHSHGMLRLEVLSKEFEDIFLSHFWKVAFDAHGRNLFTRISKGDAVGYYVAKYITKEMTDFRFIGFKDFEFKACENASGNLGGC
jgi:hypothetical protein